jgi:hypothetical protein
MYYFSTVIFSLVFYCANVYPQSKCAYSAYAVVNQSSQGSELLETIAKVHKKYEELFTGCSVAIVRYRRYSDSTFSTIISFRFMLLLAFAYRTCVLE